MNTVDTPPAHPLHALRHASTPNLKCRLVEDAFGSTFMEVAFDAAPADVGELLSLLDDIGWAPVPEESEGCGGLTADGLGSRIRVRFEKELNIDEY